MFSERFGHSKDYSVQSFYFPDLQQHVGFWCPPGEMLRGVALNFRSIQQLAMCHFFDVIHQLVAARYHGRS